MAERKPIFGAAPMDPELDALLEATKTIPVTENELREQRISFAYGNAPESSRITKDSVRGASGSILLIG